ncbi:PEP-CTERM/exosortase system-associated acyltransferase [Thiohalorhabdus sp.]|uniref:PEP-CTERM/exosortase system-associated acyltransferase n=1 Tax=Thiohalorhabdus sp. TaxID=3094134 RepID=UPI002FC2DE4E
MSIAADFFDKYFEIVQAVSWAERDAAYALRYQVYCVENPFEDGSVHRCGREQDEYDARAVHSLIRHRESGEFAACVRLVLPKQDDPETPFPIEAECGHAFYKDHRAVSVALDRSRLSEISRFAVSKRFKRRLNEASSPSGTSPEAVYQDADSRSGAGQRGMPYITVGLFAAVIRTSVEHGMTDWYAVMEPGLLRLLSRFGIHFHPVGALVEHHGRRRPTAARVADVIRGIHDERPDVWEIVSDRGRFPGLEENGPWLNERMENPGKLP